MNPAGLLEGGKELGVRFFLVGLLPAETLALFVLAIVWSGAPGEAPDLDRVVGEAEDLGGWEGTLLVLALLVAALIAQPLQLSLVRVLEGYWGSSGVALAVARPGLALHRKRREALVQAQTASAEQELSDELEARMQAAAWRLRLLYPAKNRMLPTALGNALRAAEDRAGARYGLDAVVLWPRLHPLLSDKLAAVLADQRNQLDLAARFCVVFLVAALVSLGLLAEHGPWLAVPAGALLLAWLSYRAAVASAIAYGEQIETAFDLHRFDLLRALHLLLPASRTAEREANARLSGFLRQGVPVDFAYDHDGAQGE